MNQWIKFFINYKVKHLIYQSRHLNDRYIELVSKKLLDVKLEDGTIIRAQYFIQQHRAQFNSIEYQQSRLDDSREGTIDHLHAEITSNTALELAQIKKLSGYAQLLVQVAGHLHDSDRSYPKTRIEIDESSFSDKKLYAEYKSIHAKNSCNTVLKIYNDLKNQNVKIPFEFIKDLNYIILRHEIGGSYHNGLLMNTPSFMLHNLNLNELCDIVMIADSLSYFDANIMTHWE